MAVMQGPWMGFRGASMDLYPSMTYFRQIKYEGGG